MNDALGPDDDLLCASEVRILVIDDDAATCQVIATVLAHKDFRIRTIDEPSQVEAVLKTPPENEVPFHLILLDYVLPGLEAETVLEWIRDYQPEAAVIVVTGHPSIESAVKCLRARTVDYITKPFQVAHLRQSVLRCLQSQGLLRLTEEALREQLGIALRERRKALGLTLAEVAKRSNMSVGYLSQIELGRNTASVEILYRLSLVLRMRLADLFANLPHGS